MLYSFGTWDTLWCKEHLAIKLLIHAARGTDVSLVKYLLNDVFPRHRIPKTLGAHAISTALGGLYPRSPPVSEWVIGETTGKDFDKGRLMVLRALLKAYGSSLSSSHDGLHNADEPGHQFPAVYSSEADERNVTFLPCYLTVRCHLKNF